MKRFPLPPGWRWLPSAALAARGAAAEGVQVSAGEAAARGDAADLLEHLVDSVLRMLGIDAAGNTLTHLAVAAAMLLVALLGRRIVTVEGLSSLTDVQRAFVEAGAVQCGFCTPGLVMAVHALVDGRDPDDVPDEDEIRERLSGNICRCTGYGRIMEAVRVVVRQRLGGVPR